MDNHPGRQGGAVSRAVLPPPGLAHSDVKPARKAATDLCEQPDTLPEPLGVAARSSATPGLFQTHRDWHNLLPFHEYFHGDTGRGVDACHQTGWTALVAGLVLRTADHAATGNRHD